ncbi:hypothetical protein [Streptococcus equi]|uniref:hypothetical protein n=1 Tax=Streptococcus equi TaxID=1336 RepID=UPI001E51DFAA|nr:hypothetical protein [Streptococcus equi]
MKQYEDFQMLYELDLASVNGGKIIGALLQDIVQVELSLGAHFQEFSGWNRMRCWEWKGNYCDYKSILSLLLFIVPLVVLLVGIRKIIKS